jgi:hypothetical protein
LTRADRKKFNWTVTKTDEEKLSMLEGEVLRKICGPICVNAVRRMKYADELYSLYTEPNMVKMTMLGRLKLLGHVARMEDDVSCMKRTFS